MIERNMPDVKVVGVDRGGVGTKHRKCFFMVEIRASKILHRTTQFFEREIIQ